MPRRPAFKPDVRPGQFVAVAERRFDDAAALCHTRENARANGTQYLAGLVIDILLKGQLTRAFPTIARKRSHEVQDGERYIWSLIWRSHELEQMLKQLPDLDSAIQKRGEKAGKPYSQWLHGVCGYWTVYLRYSPATSTMEEASVMLDRVRELKELLK